MKTVVLSILIIIMPFQYQAQEPDDTQSRVEKKAQSIVDLFRSRQIDRVEILACFQDLETYIRRSPEGLETAYDYKLVLRHPSPAIGEKFARALENSQFKVTDAEGDMRWGCHLYDRTGQKVLSIYMNSNGSCGTVDDITILSNGALIKELQKITKSFRE